MSAPPYSVVIADDEPLARERIRTMLAGDARFRIVAECADGDEAVATIAERRPDLVFLDVQMPEVDGFAVLEAFGDETLPAVIFVTAYDEYALRAFDVSAVDYLLKPFDKARFAKALERAVARMAKDATPAGPDGGGEIRALIEQLKRERGYATRFVVRADGKLTFVRAAEIDWIDASGNYARLHVQGRVHLVRETMKSIEGRLNPDQFVRVHRSAIINIDRVVSLEPYFHGEYVVAMRDGTRLTSSRTHSGRLRALIG
jgi:two-component system, LytTR family, response regulator